jgi:predicted anti-sigma-YlaC factor YlaD
MILRASPAAIDCSAVRAMTFDACDGEMSPLQMVMIDAHLQQCAACRLRFAADAVFLRALRAAALMDVARPSLRERVAHLLLQHAPENAPT